MSKVSNVITMLELLQTGKKYSINELSNKLEVSKRMIRVYKEDLEKAGIYIDTIMGPYGGYVLNQSVRMPIRKFKLKDAKLLDKYIKIANIFNILAIFIFNNFPLYFELYYFFYVYIRNYLLSFLFLVDCYNNNHVFHS